MSTKTDTQAISTLLQSYASALSASDTSKVISLYTSDAIFMPQHFPTITGSKAIKETYDTIFANIALHVTMDVKEVVVTSPDWAFARTTTEGVQKDQRTGRESKEGNQELFVCQRVGGEWKLARYCFCSTNAPE